MAMGYEKLTTYKNRDLPLDELTYEELMAVPLNWKAKIPWNSNDETVDSALTFLYYDDFNSFGQKKMLNSTQLRYKYAYINYEQASIRLNKYDVNRGAFPPNATVRVDTSYVDEDGSIVNQTITRPLRNRRDLISEKMVVVYPDTMVWLRDLQYSFNDPKMKMYFTHISYDDYPVIGVTWEQAVAFCDWRTKLLVPYNKQGFQEYRLPTEAEWEYAARGGRDMGLYPWGSNYVRDKYGCFLANLKPLRGDYTEDTGATTMKVGSFAPNNFGLYDMAGNVAEWTSTAYINTANTLVLDMNPNYQYNAKNDDADVLKRKVVKGGSWKDIAYYLQCGSRTYEYQYESRPYIGFRSVRSYNGE
jgi:gliding motility-associated lipoprotein GldK